jgi:hypothetical protein
MLYQQTKLVLRRMFIKDWLGQKNIQINLEIKLDTIKLKEIIKLEENKEEVNGQKNTKIVSIVQNLKGSLRSNIVNMVVTNKNWLHIWTIKTPKFTYLRIRKLPSSFQLILRVCFLFA